MVSFKEVLDSIRAFAPAISRDALSGALHAPEAEASPAQCFANAQRKAQQDGGGVLTGWMFNYREVAAIRGPGYIIAVNHAVWLAPDKRLVDVTPFHPDPKHRPIVVNGNAVLFLVDNSAAPLVSGQEGLPLPSWFFPLRNDDKAMAAHVATLTEKELIEFENQMAAREALKASHRGKALVSFRRGLTPTDD